jgi:sodium-dependent dicarboxylate transporter 2/3/5
MSEAGGADHPAVRAAGFWLGWAGLVAGVIASLYPEVLPLGLSPEAARVGGVTWLMAAWWVSEAVEPAATALVPLVAFPVLRICAVDTVAQAYSDRFILLLLGGFFLAAGLERWGLPRRIALRVLLSTGGSPQRMLLGFMLATGLISMWVSNTATVLMMLPIAMACLVRLRQSISAQAARPFEVAVLLGITYAASIGGMATPVGTPPNMFLLGLVHERYPQAPAIGFAGWLSMALVPTLLLLVIAWLYLRRRATPGTGAPTPNGAPPATSERATESLRAEVRQEHADLGPTTPAERRSGAIFFATALLWVFREPIALGSWARVPGWAELVGLSGAVDDSTVAIAAAIAMFLVPARKGARLLDWNTAVKIPWGMVLLFGGGIAIAKGFQVSGASAWIGGALGGIVEFHPLLVAFSICLAVTFLSEVTSNTATAVILLPILASAADAAQVDPLVWLFPATLAASCGFMLPVATAPNALVFSQGVLSIREMLRAGLFLNLVGSVVIALWSWLYFG